MTKLRLILCAVLLLFSQAFVVTEARNSPSGISSLRAGAYPGDVASYVIQVKLDTASKTLTGHETITYLNTTQDPIPDLVFHLYLNAFKSASTIFLSEASVHHRLGTWDPQHPGWIEVSNLKLLSGGALTLSPLEDGTLARAVLPQPVAPGQRLQVELDFTAQLPHVFARTGYAGGAAADFFMVGQWFPKLGVWQQGAWNAYPYHANSEYYADFGRYDVSLTLPGGYVTGGVGIPDPPKDNGDGTQTVTYHAERVIDFSWTASPRFKPFTRMVDGVELYYLALPEHTWTVGRVLDAAQAALQNFGAWYAPYPYPRLTLVDVPDDASDAGGMEYPTLVTLGAESSLGVGSWPVQLVTDASLEASTIHEIGHQWWYAMVGFNEAEEPWLDEGFTDYSTARLMSRLHAQPLDLLHLGNYRLSYLDERRLEYLSHPNLPMYGKAWDFNELDYAIAAYSKPVVSLITLENVLGTPVMLRSMSAFFEVYQYRHPTTQDFRRMVQQISGVDQAWFFDGLVYHGGLMDYQMVSINGQSFTARRVNGDVPLAIPTEVLVTFQDGSSLVQPWDGSGKPGRLGTGGTSYDQTFSYSQHAAIRSAVIDPQHKLVVDLQWGNNGLSARADLWSWAALATRWLYAVQNGLLLEGGW